MYTSGIPQSGTIWWICIYIYIFIHLYMCVCVCILPYFKIWSWWLHVCCKWVTHVSVSKSIGNIRVMVKYSFLSKQLMAGDQNMLRILELLSAQLHDNWVYFLHTLQDNWVYSLQTFPLTFSFQIDIATCFLPSSHHPLPNNLLFAHLYCLIHLWLDVTVSGD